MLRQQQQQQQQLSGRPGCPPHRTPVQQRCAKHRLSWALQQTQDTNARGKMPPAYGTQLTNGRLYSHCLHLTDNFKSVSSKKPDVQVPEDGRAASKLSKILSRISKYETTPVTHRIPATSCPGEAKVVRMN
ncbi:hypothetical protein STEG23_026988 [Scotinomys teguina]